MTRDPAARALFEGFTNRHKYRAPDGGPRGSLGLQPRTAILAVVVALAIAGCVSPVRSGGPANEARGSLPFTYSTFLGGSWDDGGWGLAVDGEGNAYVVGGARSLDFPTTPGAFSRSAGQPTAGNGWVTKFDARGQVVWSTFFGGNQTSDQVSGVAVDAAGRVCIGGIARVESFPTTPGAYDRSFHFGNGDAFVACLNETGSGLVYSTFLGGSDYDFATSIAIDTSGAVWVMGITASADFPTTPDAFDGSPGGMDDVFLAEISPDGSRLLYSTFLGGSQRDDAFQMVLDGSGSPYIAGYTESPDFPTTPGALAPVKSGGVDGFVTKFEPGGRTQAFSTFLGGDSYDWVRGLDVGVTGVVYATGRAGPGFPVTPGAFDTVYNSHKTFAAALNPNGTALLFSTYLGGTTSPEGQNGPTEGTIIREVPELGIWVGGSTDSSDFVTTPGAFDRTFNGVFADGFLSLLSPDGEVLHYSTYLGGENTDEILASALGARGELFLAGRTGSSEFPTTQNAFDRSENGGSDAFVLGFILGGPDLAIAPEDLRLSPLPPVTDGTAVIVNVTVRNVGDAASGLTTVRFYDGIPPAAQIGTDQPLRALPVNGGATVSVGWTASPAGWHEVCAVVDPDDVIPETDETNNTACVTVYVLPMETRPDYVPVSPQPGATTRAGLSRPVPLSVSVENLGNATATAPATLAFYNASTPLTPFATFPMPPLAPSETSSSFTASWTSPVASGTVQVVVDVDYASDLLEWNETNNRFTWTIDVVAGPVTSLAVGAPNYTAAVAYVRSATPLSLSVLDESGAGIDSTLHRVDNGTWVSGTGPFTLSGEGDHYVEWFSEDHVGNREAVSATVLVVDDSPPVTTIAPAGGPYTPETLFTLAATDAGSGVARMEFRIDGGLWAAYAGGFSVSAGDHVIHYRSADRLGNVEAEHTLAVTRAASPPLEAMNWKPLIAAAFAAILGLVGAWAARRRPWRGGTDRRAVLTAFGVVSLPFALLEAATGVVSFLTGLLSIPPLLGIGTAVDVAILISGLAVVAFRGWSRNVNGSRAR